MQAMTLESVTVLLYKSSIAEILFSFTISEEKKAEALSFS